MQAGPTPSAADGWVDAGHSGTAASHSLTGLTADKIYRVRVRAKNAAGRSGWLTGTRALQEADTAPSGNVLVSNVRQTDAFRHSMRTATRAQCFTTGSTVGGYGVGSVELDLARGRTLNASERGQIDVELWSATTDGSPSQLFRQLTTPSRVAAGNVEFAAPAGTTLAASGTYCVVFKSTSLDGIDWAGTSSPDEDAGGAAGWSIADGRHTFAGGVGWLESSGALQIRVNVMSQGDTTAPAAPTFSPAERRRGQGRRATDITITFDEALRRDAAAAAFTTEAHLKAILTLKATNDSGTPIPYAASIDDARKVITLNPDADLPEGDVYVAVSAEHFDAAGNKGSAHTATFTVDVTAPAAPDFDPADAATVTDAGTDITITFAEALRKDANGTALANADLDAILTLAEDEETGTAIPFAATIDQARKVITLNPDADLPEGKVYVAISDQHWDAAGNQGSAAAATFTVDTAAPTVAISGVPEAINATDAFTATFTFSEDVTGFATGDVTVTGGAKGTFEGSGKSYTLVVTPGGTADVVVTVAADAATDGANLGPPQAVAATARWDTTGPAAPTFSPASGDAVSSAATDITITFNEALRKDADGTALNDADLASILTLKVTNNDGNAIGFAASIDDAKKVITLDPTNDLAEGDVYVAVSAEHWDAAGNKGSAHTATFAVDTTAPTVSSAAVDGASLTIAFSENLAAAASLANSAFVVKKTPASGSEQTVTLSGSPSVSGDTVTLTLAAAVVLGDTNVKVSYARPVSGSDNKLRDAAGNEVASFTDQAVTNEAASDTVALTVSPDTLAESADATVITVTATLNGATRSATTPVTVNVNSGTATSDTDFAAVTAFTITIPANSLSHTGTFSLDPTQDTVDEPDETVAIDGSTSGLTVTDTTVKITDDDDAPTVTLALSQTSIAEADDGSTNNAEEHKTTVTASLNRASSVQTTVTVSVDPDTPATGSDYTISTNKVLTIAAGATASTGTVTITATDNDIDAADKTVKVKGDATNTVGITDPADVTLTIADDDERGVTLSSDSLTVNEGGTGTYTVKLDSEPTASVTVTPSRSGDTDVTVSGVLTFTTSNWSGAQTVTVSAAQDGDAGDDTAEIAHTVTGGDYASLAAGSVSVTVDDDETASSTVTLTVSPDTLAESAEATDITVTATLNGGTRSETTPVAVSVGSGTATSGTDFATVTGFTITIPANSLSHTGTFSLDPTQDTVDEDDETVAVEGSTTVNGLTVTDTTVKITDDDTRGVTLSSESLTVNEGSSNTYTVKLDSQPTASVTVTPSHSSGDSDVTVSGALTFTTANWSDTQTVTVSAAQDGDPDDDTAEIGHAVSGGDYGSVSAGSVSVTVDDDETASSTVTLTVSPGEVAESANATEITVTATLNGGTRSAATPVAVSIGSGTATSGTDFGAVTDFTITIPANALSHTGTFSLDPTQDSVDEDDETVNVDGSTTVDGLTVTDTTVKITDDDTRGVTLSSDSLSVNEGSSNTYTVKLDSQPTASVTVTPSRSSGDADVTVSGALTFSTSNWSQTQTVTVSAAEDGDPDDDSAVIGHALTGGDYASLNAGTVSVTVNDDETASDTVTLTASPESVSEGAGATDITVTATLNGGTRSATTPVTVNVNSGTATSGTDFAAVSAFTITIPANSLSHTGTFSLNPTQDTVDEDDESVNVDGSTTVDGLSVTDTTVKITDDDERGVTLSVESLTVNEGSSDTYTVKLDSQPTASVTVTPSRSSGDGDVTVSGALTFTTANWSDTQTVTVSAAEDGDPDDDTAEIGHAVTGGDYASLTAGSVSITVTDDETASSTVALTASPGEVAESANATEITVTATLNGGTRSATTPVTVNVNSGTATSGTDFTAVSAFTITIPANSLSHTGTFSLDPTQDSADEDDETVNVDGSTNVSGLSVTNTTVKITDDDTRGVTLSSDSLSVNEGSSNTYTVKLDSQPTASVTVTPSRSSGDTDVTVSGALTFTTANWSDTQTVTVSAAEDGDPDDDTAQIGHAVSGGDYGSVSAGSVSVTVDDDETASNTVALTVSPGEVAESANATEITVTATLNGGTRSATTPVAVAVGSGTATSGTDFAAVTDFTITIPANSLSHTGTFSLDPTQDTVDEPDETVAIDGSTSVSGLSVTDATVKITDDDATPTVTLALSRTSIAEADNTATPNVEEHKTTVTATLDSASSVQTTVTISVDPDSPATSSDYTISTNKVLTIAAGATASTGTVTITATDNDVDAANKTVKVKGSATNTVGVTDPTDVTLTIADDDTAGVTLSDTSLTVTEGETATYTVVLDSKPAANVTVTPTSGDEDKATVSGAVEFTPSNWNQTKTVTVTGEAEGSATVTHAASSTDAGYPSNLAIDSVAVTVKPPDTTAPTVEFNPANGDTVSDAGTNIVLTFSEAIRKDASDTELANADLASILTLKTNNASGTPILYAATIDDAKTKITINPSASLSDGAVYVAVNNEYYDEAGNQGAMATATFTVDTTAPTVSSATVDGASLTITFNENLAAAANLANSAFEVKKTPASGSEQSVTLSGSPSVSGATVTLTLATAAAHDDTAVKVSYTKPVSGSDNTLEDAAGNEVASFTDRAVTNNTRGPDAALSALSGSTSTDGSAFTGTLDIGAFAAGRKAYRATVANAVTHVKLTPAANRSDATVKVGKRGTTLAAVTSGSASAAIALAAGANVIEVEVTAADGGTRTYTVTVTRRAAALVIPTGPSALVSNLGQSSSLADHWLATGTLGGIVYAQGFTTGSHADGYTLAGIDAALAVPFRALTAGEAGKVRAELWSATSGGLPNAKIASLTVPESIATGAVSFTDAAQTVLDGSKTYFLVLYANDSTRAVGTNTRAQGTGSGAEDAGAAAGWSIADTHARITGSFTASGTWSGNRTEALKIAVKGTPRILPPSTLTLSTSATNDTAAEDDGTVTVTAKLNRPVISGEVTVALAAGSGTTATATGDYTLPAALTIAAGQTTATANVTLVNDDRVEDSEDLALTATVSGLAVTGVTLTITDDDAEAAKIAFGADAAATVKYAASVAEDGGTLNVPVTVSHLPASSTAFAVEVLDTGTAAENTDYSIAMKTVTFGPTDTSRTKNLSIAITDDSVMEPGETIELRIAAADSPATALEDHYARDGNGALATVTIANDAADTAPVMAPPAPGALVSNLGQNAGSATEWFATNSVAGNVYAQAFSTGGNADGYTLAGIDATLEHPAGTGTLTAADIGKVRAELWSATTGGLPNARLAGLTVPASISTGAVSFTDAAKTVLDDSTTYFVVLYVNDSTRAAGRKLKVQATTSGAEDAGAAAGWSIADRYVLIRGSFTPSGTWSRDISRALNIAVRGAARTLPPSTLELSTSATNDTAAEDAGTVTVTATLNRPVISGEVTVALAAGSGTTATATEDYTLPAALTISAGESSATASVTLVDDDLVEDSEDLALTATVSGLAVTGVKLTIADDDAEGAKIAFGADAAATVKYAASVAEDGGTLNVPVTVSHLPASSTAFAVEVLDTGTAVENTDYSIAMKTVTFGPTDTDRTKNVSVAITDDSVLAPDKTIELKIAAADSPANDLGDHYARDANGALATVTIANDEPPPAPTVLVVTEGHAKLDLSWTAPTLPSGVSLAGYDLHYTSAPASGNGSVADDAAVQTGAQATAAGGWLDASHSGTDPEHEITGLDNDTEYRLRVRAANAAGASAWLTGTGTPEEEDTTAPTVEFNPANGATVTDADTNIVLTFSEAIRKDASDTELVNADLSSILTLKTNNVSGTPILHAATINEAKTAITINPSSSLDEGAVYVAVSDEYYDEAGNQGAVATATFTVDTTAPTVSSAAVDGVSLTIAFSENLAAAANLANSAFVVKKTPASGSEQTVTLSGSPSVSGDTVTLTLAAAVVLGDTDVKVSYARPVSGSDNKLRDAAGNEVASFTDQAVTNEAASDTVALTVSPDTLAESADATVITVTATLNGATRSATTPVIVNVNSGTATSGTDFATVTAFTITIPANSLSHTGTFSLDPTQDAVDEPDETVAIDGSTSVSGLSVTDTTVKITDDDDMPTVTLALSQSSIAEADDGSTNNAEEHKTTVTASLNRASSVQTTVTISVAPDSPATGSDYTISANKVLTIAAGATASTGTVTITAADNDIDAADKTVKVKGDAANTVGVTDPTDVTLTIADDDERGVTLSSDSLTVNEGSSNTYTVKLDSQPTASVTVTPSHSSGDSDVTVSGPLTFTTSNWSETQTVTVSAAQDGDAGDDTAEIAHTVTGGDYASVTAGSVSVTVDDDETASSTVTLTVSPGEVAESANATEITVTATLNGGTRSETTPVAVSVGSGTATSGTDFAAVTGFTITIPANSLSHTGTFSLNPTQDTVDEPDETVAIDGSTSVSGLGVTDTTVKITDDDATPTVTLALSPTSIAEADDGGTSGVAEHRTTVTATLDSASSVQTTVTISVEPNSPATSSDYSISANKVLTIAAGQTASTGTGDDHRRGQRRRCRRQDGEGQGVRHQYGRRHQPDGRDADHRG